MENMENTVKEQVTTAVYEPPMLVEVGEFSEDTLGISDSGSDLLGKLGSD
ncbi:MAG: lasso RiPP family leader peptide-containing protein [Pseudonocardiaceae bacterium]